MDDVCEIEIQWGDCDPAGIVFFPNYFAWFDRGVWQLFTRIGVPIEGLLRAGRCAAMPITHAEADFSNPCRPGDLLRLISRIASVEARRINIEHEASCRGLPILRGRETRAWTVAAPDKPSGIRGADIPDDVAAKLRAAVPAGA